MLERPDDPQTERIEQLLLQILEAPDDQRSEAVAAVCRGAGDLAPRLRRRLQELSRFGLVTGTGDGAVADRTPVPERIGQYRVLQTLGRGGMGVVYLAEHAQLGRRVAVKCIRAEFLGSERARERFRRETQAAARLQHPSICTLFEAGEWEGQPYLAMQFVEGEPLDEQLRRARALGRTCWSGELSRETASSKASTASRESGGGASGATRTRVRDAVDLVVQLARAVHFAHEAGLLHRDLKPANVMVTREGRPVLLDFGLARDLETDGPGLTLSSDVVGTPAYMAPEQVDPRDRRVDRATDVHALGAILYECLTLRPPFAGSGREDTYRRILTEEPVDLRRLQPAAGRDLASVIQKALAKEPARRFRSALEMADELGRVLRGEPTLTRPAGPLRRSLAWARRNPVVAGALVALFVTLVAGLSTAIWLLRDARAANKTYASRELVTRDPAAAALLAADALDLGGGEPARSALHESLTWLRLVQAWPLLNTAAAVAATPDGSILAAACYCRADQVASTVHLFRQGEERQLDVFGRTRVLQLDAERDRVLVVGPLPTACLFDLRGERIADLPGQPPEMLQLLHEKPPRERIAFGLIAGGIQGHDVYTVTRDGEVRLFDVRGSVRAERSFHAASPAGGWLSADRDPRSGRIALGARDGSVALWSAAGEKLWHRPMHAGQVRFVAFAPHGGTLLCAAGYRRHWLDVDDDVEHDDSTARILELDGATRLVLRAHTRWLTSASWSPDGRHVLTTSDDRTARIWTVDPLDPEGRARCTVLNHDNMVDHGQFFPDGWRVLTTMTTGEAVVWELGGQRLTELRGHVSGAYAGTVIGAGDRVLTASMDKRLLSWDVRSRWCSEWRSRGPVAFAGFDPAGETIATVSSTGFVEKWARDLSRPVATADLARFLADGERIGSGAFDTRSGRLLVGTSRERILEVAPGGNVTELRAPDRAATTPAAPLQAIRLLLPDRDRILFVAGLHGLSLRSVARDEGIPPLPQQPERSIEFDEDLTSVAWIPDGIGFSVGSDGAKIRAFDASGRAQSELAQGLGSPVMGLAWAPDSRCLFAATRDGLLFKIDRAGAPVRVADLGVYLSRLTIAPAGARLAVASGSDRRVRILDDSGRLHLTLPPLRDGIRSLAFSSDGRRLLVASFDGDLRLWPLDLEGTGEEVLARSPYQEALERARAAVR